MAMKRGDALGPSDAKHSGGKARPADADNKSETTHTEVTQLKELKVRVTFIQPLLGTKPADPEIHTRYVASKAPDAKTMEQEIAALGAEEVEDRTKTLFPKLEDGTPYIKGYQLAGYFKETARVLKKVPGSKTSKLTAYLKKIDNNIFVRGNVYGIDDEIIPLFMPYELDLSITDCQRPLRASTPQGERIALAHSEVIPAGTYFECYIYTECDDDAKYVLEWLDHGAAKGMGQWRNSGKGRFIYEVLSERKMSFEEGQEWWRKEGAKLLMNIQSKRDEDN